MRYLIGRRKVASAMRRPTNHPERPSIQRMMLVQDLDHLGK
jgi:hypothetical protein